MEIDKIRELIELMEEKDLVCLELENSDSSISLTRHYDTPVQSIMASTPQAALPSAVPAESATPSGAIETSPMVGVFYVAPSPNDAPFVKPGQKVQAGDTLGIIEAMKIMNHLEATQSGIIDEILVNNGDVVQFGQPIVRFKN